MSAASANLVLAKPVGKFISEHPTYSQETPERQEKRASSLMKNQDPGGTGLVRVYGLTIVTVGSPDPYAEQVDLVVQFDIPIIISWDEFKSKFPLDNRVARMDSPFFEALLRQ